MDTTIEVLFNSLGLSEQVLKAVVGMGYTAPTEIQAKSIPVLMSKKDLIGQAQTGTGKTVAFGIPVIESIDATSRNTQAIILCPTRELALQVAKQLEDVARYHSAIKVVTLVGGQPLEPQMRSLKYGAQIVVGTPGRVIDHIDRKTLQLNTVKFVVLDEADEMLDMGFRDDIEAILKKTPSERQTALFSATMPPEIRHLAKEYQKNPEVINLVPKETSVVGIEQIYFEVQNNRKSDLLASLLDIDQPNLAIAFCNTIQRVDELARKLQEAGYSADALHGDMRQSRRDRVMDRFRSGDCKILIATDVAARGIDVAGIEVVFNVDLPMDHENYVHRIGRTGRAGRTGKAYSFVGGRDRMLLKTISRHTNGTIEQRALPSMESVEKSRSERIFSKITAEAGSDAHLEKYLALVKTYLGETGDAVKLAAALIKNIIHKNRPATTEFSSESSERREGGRRFGGDREGGRRSFGGDREGGRREWAPRGGDREGGRREWAPRGGDREGGRSFGGGEKREWTPRGDREGGRSFGEKREWAPRGDREGGRSFGGGEKREWTPRIDISEGGAPAARPWRNKNQDGENAGGFSRRNSDFSGAPRRSHAS
jgi:ATP-dependent RNA helicase DeaD